MTPTEEQVALVTRALDGALREEENAVNDSLNQLGMLSGWRGMFGACCAFAEAINRVQPVKGEGPASLVAFNVHTGDTVNIEQTGMEPELIAACRIVTAIANKEFDAAAAVFFAEVDADRGHDTVAATLALAVEALREHPRFGEVYGRKP